MERQLIAVNDVELTYDEVGNVLTYGDKAFTWNSGRNLESIVDGDNNYSYTYDENGIRTSKTVNGVTTYYNTRNGVIISQSDGTNTMYFQYDMNGLPIGFIFNGTQYFYMTNQMGDIIAITEFDGNIIAQYVYDEWGKLLNVYTVNEDNAEQVEIANVNPLHYCGYYYDTETGYYYLQSRYYDASICRFINTDIPEITKISKEVAAGTNIFAYCNNNSVNNSDPTGYFNFENKLSAFAILSTIYSAISILVGFTPLKALKISKYIDLALSIVGIATNIYSCINKTTNARKYYGRNSASYKKILKYNIVICALSCSTHIVSYLIGRRYARKATDALMYY